jgi:2-methylcitrate dehydratase PrpD
LGGNIVNNGYAAKHSIPYKVAARIVYGATTMDVYTDEHVKDSRTAAVLQKNIDARSKEVTALLPDIRAAWVRVPMTPGQQFTARSDVPEGGFDNPLSADELEQTFKHLAIQALDADDVTALNSQIFQLPGMKDLAVISRFLKQA